LGLTTDAPIAAVTEFRKRFSGKYGYVPDHSSIEGYLAI
jgi:branched-chain amino acid transport system substrate-binding protein